MGQFLLWNAGKLAVVSAMLVGFYTVRFLVGPDFDWVAWAGLGVWIGLLVTYLLAWSLR